MHACMHGCMSLCILHPPIGRLGRCRYANMSGPNHTEKSILAASKSFDDALSSKDAGQLKATLASDGVVLHHGAEKIVITTRMRSMLLELFFNLWDGYLHMSRSVPFVASLLLLSCYYESALSTSAAQLDLSACSGR